MFVKNYHLHWIAGRGNILSKYEIYIFFNFGRGFCCSFPKWFSKASASCCKKTFLLHCASIFMASKSVSQILKILFQTGDIEIFVLCGVFFSRYVLLKSSFSGKKKHQQWNLGHNLVKKLLKINEAKYERKISLLAEVGALESYS